MDLVQLISVNDIVYELRRWNGDKKEPAQIPVAGVIPLGTPKIVMLPNNSSWQMAREEVEKIESRPSRANAYMLGDFPHDAEHAEGNPWPTPVQFYYKL